MAVVLGIQGYSTTHLKMLDVNTTDDYVYFSDRQIAEEINPISGFTLDYADATMHNIISILKLTHSDIPEFEDRVDGLGGEESENGFLLTKDQFACLIAMTNDTLHSLKGEEVIYQACKNRDKLQAFYIDTDWDTTTVYVNRYSDDTHLD